MSEWTLDSIRNETRRLSGRTSIAEMPHNLVDSHINRYVRDEFPADVKLDRNYTYYERNLVVNQRDYTLPENFTNFEPRAYVDAFPLVFYNDPDYFESQNPYPILRYRPWTAPGSANISSFTNANPGVIETANVGNFTNGDTVEVSDVTETGGGTTLDGTYTLTTASGTTLTTATDTTAYAVYSSGGTVRRLQTQYTATISNRPILAGSVIVDDTVEVFTDDGSGTLTGDQGGNGSINYTTGAIEVNFNTAPSASQSIDVSYIPYKSGRPTSVLLWNNQFRFYPIPDRVYRFRCRGWSIDTVVATDGTKSSTFNTGSDAPLLDLWGLCIAYGAARRIVAQYGDDDKYQILTALYFEQVDYVTRRTIQGDFNRRSMPRF